MKKLLCFLMVGCVTFLPSFAAFAQDAGFSVGGQGQAFGTRRQMNRNIQSGGVSSFNRSQTNDDNAEYDFSNLRRIPTTAGMGGYQVHVLGQIQNPGTYRFPPSTRLDEAVTMAGGLQTRGSKRNIELRRKDGVARYDLFRFQTFGDLSQNPFLLDNDVIFVPYGEHHVILQGPVKQTGTFELSSRDQSIWDLLQLAGGFTAGVSKSGDVTVIRYVDTEKQLFEIKNIEPELKEFLLQHGDIVVIPHLLTKEAKFDYDISALPADNLFYPSFNDNVFVLGSVALPGGYPFNPHYSVREFVYLAGPQVNANLKRMYILTAQGKRIKRDDFGMHRLSPGDTIVVPSRAWTTDNVVKWYTTVTTSVLAGAAVYGIVK
ncbi:MAG: hypothetical protein A3C46_05715 [Deltaproteobacteria bacterium RIFCSPHIGHO2_02_FULL_44_16]|nr:MAG: hypothetical protein A3C46_05715 [Deltaproteobacteria bacterium RIFCSPHIGHO2_02_FULL_44_16]